MVTLRKFGLRHVHAPFFDGGVKGAGVITELQLRGELNSTSAEGVWNWSEDFWSEDFFFLDLGFLDPRVLVKGLGLVLRLDGFLLDCETP